MLNKDRILAEIKKRGCKSVGLQFPEGLKRNILELADALQASGLDVVLVGEPCYGACDIVSVPCDVLIHFGHAPIREDKNVIYEEIRFDCELEVLDKCVPILRSPVGLVTNVQHVHQLLEIKKYLEGNGLKILIGKGTGRVKYSGQILGCDFSAAAAIKTEVESFLYFGSGDFHSLGVALTTNKTVIAADPFSNRIKDMAELKDRFMRQRFAAIELASRAEKYGILISSKFGQMHLNLAQKLVKKLNEHGKKAFMFYFNYILPDYLEGYDIDAFVSTACPRIAIDDYSRFKKPLINPKELEIVLKERKWDDYELDEIN
jgi:2-(3-amino-3-carboxypropyl)histidine synthase